MAKSLAISKFCKLVSDIFQLYQNARKAQVMFAWETGRRIVEVEQDGAVKAEYGDRLLSVLSEALTKKCGPGFSQSNLYDMRKFYLANKIFRAPGKLTWSNYSLLQRIKDPEARRGIQKRAANGIPYRELRRLVSQVNSDGQKKTTDITPLKRPADLKLNTFRKSPLKNVKLPEGGTLIDCGFFVNWVVRKEDLADLKLTETPSYTYSATVERTIDGDTLLVLIDVGFGIIVRDKLRLRGINTPELGTPQGDKAKRFVEKLLPPDSTIVLKSHKSATDKYGRFVADVFYKTGTDNPQEIIDSGTYLNQELLDQGLAERVTS